MIVRWNRLSGAFDLVGVVLSTNLLYPPDQVGNGSFKIMFNLLIIIQVGR